MYIQKPKLHKRQKAHKFWNLRTIALDVTPLCNMQCECCYAETFAHVEPVKLSILRRAMNEAYEMGVYHCVLQGGEPIVDLNRLEAILHMCHSDETYITIVKIYICIFRDCLNSNLTKNFLRSFCFSYFFHFLFKPSNFEFRGQGS